MELQLNLPQGGYHIVIERGCIHRAGELLNLNRKVLIVTDEGVPHSYAETVAGACRQAVTVRVPQGEESKSLQTFERLSRVLLQNDFTRTDCVVAVGGGVVGDLAGFVAASYMRGIDFYNIPTTVLSQVDSSIGGKVAVNLDGIKNIIGAFYQPCAVLIDPDTLKTLPNRQISNGLAEAVKMALTFDADLFELFEKAEITEQMETIITRSLQCKQRVVEQDEKEHGLRRVLNFGHTIGHAIESAEGLCELYHGECVALGMLPMCSEPVRKRLIAVLEKLNLPVKAVVEPEAVCAAVSHDKKFEDNLVTTIFVPEVGSYRLDKITKKQLTDRIKEYYKPYDKTEVSSGEVCQ